jgi:transcriptional regulator with XRE-family HTH domain
MIHYSFGQAVSLWRQAKALSQERLARLAGMSRPNLSAIERDRRDVGLRTIRALATGLGVEPGTLVDGVAPPMFAPQALSRDALERIADAVAAGKPTRSDAERTLANALSILTGSRRQAQRGVFRPVRQSRRAAERAWLVLAAYPKGTAETLLQRIADRHAQR